MSAAALFEFVTERPIAELLADLRAAWVGRSSTRYLAVWNRFAPREALSGNPLELSGIQEQVSARQARHDWQTGTKATGNCEWLCEAGWYFGPDDDLALAQVARLILEAASGPAYYFRDPQAIEYWYWRLRRGEVTWAPLTTADLPAHAPNMDSNSGGYVLSDGGEEGRTRG